MPGKKSVDKPQKEEVAVELQKQIDAAMAASEVKTSRVMPKLTTVTGVVVHVSPIEALKGLNKMI